MPEITVLIYTARGDHPYVGKAEGWHCFEPFLRTLADQTFKDFELVLVDALWETRSDWFASRPQPFHVKHVPTSPNYWQERGRIGLAAQLNRGFAWADGGCVWMGGENNLFPPHHLQLISDIHRSGKVPVAWYSMADRGYVLGIDSSDRGDGKTSREEGTTGPCPPVSFNMHGFVPHDLYTMDHRAARFVTDSSIVTSPCHHQNYFGYSAMPLELALRVNGFDELMDGRMGLQDCDMGGRLVRAGAQLVMHRDLYVIEPPTKFLTAEGFGGGIRHQPPFQCNYAILLHNELTGRRVNTALPPRYIADVQDRICNGICPLQDKCRSGQIGEGKVYPFCAGETEGIAHAWYAVAPVRELAEEQRLRFARAAPYDRGFIR